MKRIIAFIAIAFLGGCVTDAASSYAPSTASGKPEVTIKAPVAAIKSALISRAMNKGYSVTKDSDYVLQIEKKTDNLGAAVLLGSKYDSVPAERYVFTFAQVNNEVRVVASTMFVTNPGSAFEQLTPVTTGQAVQNTESSLNEVKTQLEAEKITPTDARTSQKKKK